VADGLNGLAGFYTDGRFLGAPRRTADDHAHGPITIFKPKHSRRAPNAMLWATGTTVSMQTAGRSRN
jgi:hypothetical protein